MNMMNKETIWNLMLTYCKLMTYESKVIQSQKVDNYFICFYNFFSRQDDCEWNAKWCSFAYSCQ